MDEHNRHKRLKGMLINYLLGTTAYTGVFIVMRACEGCRRRKIKCDAATTNTWPCAACVRLKLQCVPPSLNYDRVHGGGGSFESVLDFDHSSASGEDEQHGHQLDGPPYYDFGDSTDSLHNTQAMYSQSLPNFNGPATTDASLHQPDFTYGPATPMPMTLPESYRSHAAYQNIKHKPRLPAQDNTDWKGEQCSAADLSDVMGELNIKENGVGMYCRSTQTTNISTDSP